jgi:hypothetical protein
MQLDREEGIVNEKTHVALLRNITEVWVRGETFHSTDDLISMLVARFPRSWGSSDKYPRGLTAQRLGRMLVKNYGVYSDRTADKVRGYFARSFDVACRSVRVPPIEPAEPVRVVEPGQTPLVDDHPCSVCDQKMLLPASIERGHCERCERTLRRDGNAA